MNSLLNLTIASPLPLGEPFNLAEKLLRYRNQQQRTRAVWAANRAMALLADMGIRSRVFGALTHTSSDEALPPSIDLCIDDDSSFNGPDGPRYLTIMHAVSLAADGLMVQVHFLSRLSPAIAELVQSSGRSHLN